MKIKNPIVEKCCADPEARIYGGKYYIYVTKGNVTVYSSSDLENWTEHENILAIEEFPHVHKCIWAPTIIDKDGKYYLFFASNDIHSSDEAGGIEIAVSDSPTGPFRAYIEGSLIGEFHNGAQPIDAHVFRDDDGTVYLYYGGWRHCNVCRLSDDFKRVIPLTDDSDEMFREITPDDYVEAPCMLKSGDKYYFMWSAGSWELGDYHVNYAVSDSPISGFKGAKSLLETQLPVAEGPGHNGYLYLEDRDTYLMVYHRRVPGDAVPYHRYLCIDKMNISDGEIKPVVMTNEFEL